MFGGFFSCAVTKILHDLKQNGNSWFHCSDGGVCRRRLFHDCRFRRWSSAYSGIGEQRGQRRHRIWRASTVAILAIVYSLAQRDFSIALVANHSLARFAIIPLHHHRVMERASRVTFVLVMDSFAGTAW